jgi:hypothetical protein
VVQGSEFRLESWPISQAATTQPIAAAEAVARDPVMPPVSH